MHIIKAAGLQIRPSVETKRNLDKRITNAYIQNGRITNPAER